MHATLFSVASLLTLLLAEPALRAATYAPASTAAIDWTPNVASGVGVPGGIPARSTIYTTLTTTGDMTDRLADIYAALIACPAGQTVKLGPGPFAISYTEFRQHHLGGKTLRGSGSDPATGTVIHVLPGGNGIKLRGSDTYLSPLTGEITGTPAKGATTLAAANLTTWLVNRLVELQTENDDTLPVMSVGGSPFIKRQTVLVTAVDTGAGTMTFQPPLYQTPVKRTGGALVMRWLSHTGALAPILGAGLEDFVIDGLASDTHTLLSAGGMHGCWFKNIRVKNTYRHGMYFGESAQIELRDCVIMPTRDTNWGSSNHGGLGLGAVSGSLFENNIIEKHFPLIKMEGAACAGNVFGYNFILQHYGYYVGVTHNAGNHCNLWEGNAMTSIQTDGYFGSAADDVVFRNDLHGVVIDPFTTPFYAYPVQLSRFTRRWEIVGNQLGRTGTTYGIETWLPTAFNGSSNGVANNYAGDPHVDLLLTGVLTTRTGDGTGTVTLDTTVGQLENPDVSQLGVTWGTGLAATGRYGVGKGEVNPTTRVVTLTGGGYESVLPAQGTAVRLWPNANGYRERDDATAQSLVRLGNYYAKDNVGIPAVEALGSTTLPASLYRSSAPSFMAGYNWPPYDPVTRDTRFAAIPAGARYEATRNQTPRMPTISPISTSKN
ncbi:MAG: hypothetical protein JNK23_11380 [Opitutaceae bacterium]|nr:hypothetical protein [Opitutaceae bacterium]